MQKTWKEIRTEVIALGFEKEKSYDKYKDSFLSAFNWAMTHIATTLSPIYAEAEFVVKENTPETGKTEENTPETGKTEENTFVVGRIKLKDICPDLLRVRGFMCNGANVNLLIVNDSVYITEPGNYTICYHKYPKVCGGDDNYVCEIDYAYANIIAYLVAHRVWMDDDMSKSVLYWNTFEELKNQLAVSSANVTVSGGWI